MERFLRRAGHDVLTASDGKDALTLVERYRPDIVALDIFMNDPNGVEVCKGLRGVSPVPVLILSTASDEDTIVEALDAGADDYVTKATTSPAEMLLRLEMLYRRYQESLKRYEYRDDYLHVSLYDHLVSKDGQRISLAPREWDVLGCLLRRLGQVVPYQQLIRDIYGNADPYEPARRRLAVSVRALRISIEKDAHHPEYVQTKVGEGYLFVDRRSA